MRQLCKDSPCSAVGRPAVLLLDGIHWLGALIPIPEVQFSRRKILSFSYFVKKTKYLL